MDKRTSQILNSTTAAFYAAQAQSFSDTRQSPWAGWERVVAALPQQDCRILDVACGNLRFEKYAQGARPAYQDTFYAVDSCAELVAAGEAARVHFTPVDINNALIERGSVAAGLSGATAENPADATVCFGFMHHVAGFDARAQLLRDLCAATQPGGLVAVSLWRFMEVPALAQKAQESHTSALAHFASEGVQLDLDENDFLLGWQNAAETFRYAHHFDQAEVDALVAAVSDAASLADRFFADGRTGALNEYLLFRVNAR